MSGIRLRLAILALAFAAPIIGNQLWVSAQSRQGAIARASARVEEFARLAAVEEEDSLQEASNLLHVLTHVPVIANASRDGCHELLREITNEHPRIDLIGVERADGSIACTSEQPVAPTYTVEDRKWFKEAMAPDAPAIVVSDFLISRAKGSPGVIVASALSRTSPTETPGVVSALMKLVWFSEIAAKLADTPGASVQIVEVDSGTVVAQSGPGGKITTAQPVPTRLTEALRTSPQGTIQVQNVEGIVEIVGYRWLPSDQGLHSAVLVRMRRSTIVEEANQQLAFGLFTIAFALLGGVLLAWCVAEFSIVQPLSALARMAIRLGGGDLEARVTPHKFGVAEMKVLATTLNRAVEQIQLRDSKLERLTLRDPLTGLANRRCLDIALGREWLRAALADTSVALLMIDVDFFKLFNDSYGHLAGDECLRRIAAAVEGEARSTLDVAARYGGEEIALLLPSIDFAEAVDIANRVVCAVRQLSIPHQASSIDWVTVSVGLAVGAPSSLGDGSEALIESADRALYEAKRSGRNRAIHVNCMDRAAQLA